MESATDFDSYYPPTQFDYDEVDRNLGAPSQDPLSPDDLLSGFRLLIDWLDAGKTPAAKIIRLQAVKFALGDGTQTQLAARLGCTKAAISRVANELRDTFGLHLGGMRSPEARAKFSELCKSRAAAQSALPQSLKISQRSKLKELSNPSKLWLVSIQRSRSLRRSAAS
jgi:hypothetical protein